MIPDDFIQELLARVDIVDVISKYVQLKKSGQNLQGLCPFHQEKSPSFTVSPTKQFYHCFGCGAHGSALGFIMDHVGLSFPEAVRVLADSVGMQVPQRRFSPKDKERKTRFDMLHEVLERAQSFYHTQLQQFPKAQEYLLQRGLTPEIAERFGLGWTGMERQNLRRVFESYDNQLLIDAGLVVQSERGTRYDRFRERITFPIYNQRGRIIGFGGRVIGKAEPKYLNSPETELFHKGSELYGLYENRSGIHKASTVLVVEGYMDVVSLASYGVNYAVATLGTATTAEHLAKLIKVSHRIVFSFDGDEAGQKAAWRALNAALPLLRDDLSIRFLFLPKEHDPDSYVQNFGVKKFEEQINEAQALSAFMLQSLAEQFNLEEAEGRAACLKEALSLVEQIPESMIRTQIENELSRLVRFTPDEFSAALARYRIEQENAKRRFVVPDEQSVPSRTKEQGGQSYQRQGDTESRGAYGQTSRRPPYQGRQSKDRGRSAIHQPMPLARRLLSLLVNYPAILETISERQLEILRQHPHMDVVVELIALCFSSGAYHLGSLLQQVEQGSPLQQLLLSLANDDSTTEPLPHPELEWADAIKKVELDNLEAEIKQLLSAGPETEAERKRYSAVLMRYNFLKS